MPDLESKIVRFADMISEYTLVRSRRKTIAIQIMQDGSVVVKAPLRLAKYRIDEFVAAKSDWILRKQDNCLMQIRKYSEGEEFAYLGKMYPLHIVCQKNCNHTQAELRDNRFWICTPDTAPDRLKAALRDWYISHAKEIIPKRVNDFLPYIGKPVRAIHIKEQKTRWGSCSSLGNLNFNWKIIMAPPEVVDYVIVHELCHLLQMNHSAQFWQEVSKILPEYRKYRKWLKENGKMLEL